MIIFYSYKYNNSRGESRRLLAQAISGYIEYRRAPGSVQAGTCKTIYADGRISSVPAAELKSTDAGKDASYAGRDASDEAARLTAELRTAGEFGKPYRPGYAPFSRSHSMNTWAVLILEPDDMTRYGSNDQAGTDVLNCSCGLDIQYERKANAVSIANRFFAPEDAAVVRELRDSVDGFFRLWARREALVKAIGTSVAATDIPSASGDAAEYQGVRYEILDAELQPDASDEPGACRLHAAICIRR